MDAAVRGVQEQVTTSCKRLVTALQARGDKIREHSQKREGRVTALWRIYHICNGLKFLGPVNQEYDDMVEELENRIADCCSRSFVTDVEENRKRDLTYSELRKIMQQASDLQPAAGQALQDAPPEEEAAAEEEVRDEIELAAAERADARQLKELGALRGEMLECQRHGRPPVTEPQAIADAFIEATSRMRDLAAELAIESRENLQRATDHNNKMIALSIIGWNEVEEAHKTASVCYEALLKQAAQDGSYTAESTETSFDDAKTSFERCATLLEAFNNWSEEFYRRYSKDATRFQKLCDVLGESSDSVSLVKAINFEKVAE